MLPFKMKHDKTNYIYLGTLYYGEKKKKKVILSMKTIFLFFYTTKLLQQCIIANFLSITSWSKPNLSRSVSHFFLLLTFFQTCSDKTHIIPAYVLQAYNIIYIYRVREFPNDFSWYFQNYFTYMNMYFLSIQIDIPYT